MTNREWIEKTFVINEFDDEITWNEYIATPNENFMRFFDEPIQVALENEENVIQAIMDSDPNDEKGFHKYLKSYL